MEDFTELLLYSYVYDNQFVVDEIWQICATFSDRFRLEIDRTFFELFSGIQGPVTPELIKKFKQSNVPRFTKTVRNYAVNFPNL
jgi:hypothetical protein